MTTVLSFGIQYEYFCLTMPAHRASPGPSYFLDWQALYECHACTTIKMHPIWFALGFGPLNMHTLSYTTGIVFFFIFAH